MSVEEKQLSSKILEINQKLNFHKAARGGGGGCGFGKTIYIVRAAAMIRSIEDFAVIFKRHLLSPK